MTGFLLRPCSLATSTCMPYAAPGRPEVGRPVRNESRLNELGAATTTSRSQRYTGRAHRIYRVSSTHRARGGGRESRLHVSGSIDGPPILQVAGDEPTRQRPDETDTPAGEHVT